MTARRGRGGSSKRENVFDLNFGGLLKGFSDLVEKLGELAETGKELQRTGEIRTTATGKDVKGVYGFSVKVGLGGEGVHVEPFGNIRKDESSGEAVVHEVREPMVDVFEEEDHTVVVSEMPGVSADDLRLDLKDDILVIHAEKGDRKYHKEVLLPQTFAREKMTVSCTNGVVEIKFRK